MKNNKKNAPSFISWKGINILLLLAIILLPFISRSQTVGPPVVPFPPFVTPFTFTQVPSSCGGFIPEVSLPTIASANCSATSPDYTNKYNKQSFYIPTANDPVITINLTFHVFNKSDGSGSWQPTGQSLADLTFIKNALTNWYDRYSDPRNANYTVSGWTPPTNILDSRVNYSVTNIYYYNDNAMNTVGGFNGSTLLNYINSNPLYAGRLSEGMPILFNNAVFSGYTGYASVWNGAPYIHTAINVPPHDVWFSLSHLWHEIGHCVGWMHTYGPSASDLSLYPCGNSDFLSDVFPTNNPNCPSNPQLCTTCFENASNLPLPISSNNVMADPKLGWPWMSPLQMGRRIRNLHLPSNGIRKFAKDMQSDHLNPWLISTNETWDFDIQMYRDIVVKTGNTLTIKCKVGMPLDGKIVVEKGAKLLVDGGEIYGWCKSGLWVGIEVDGTYNKHQGYSGGYAIYQGIAEFLNGAKISDAWNAVTTGVTDAVGNFNWTSMGGVVLAKDAYFVNNVRDIQFMSYSNPNNRSVFVNSKFQINSLLKAGILPYTRVTLWEVQNVKFFGCEFSYNGGNAYPVTKRGAGIGSVDAKYFVDSYCPTNVFPCISPKIQSLFLDLDNGVIANNSNPLRIASIKETKFLNNYTDGANFSVMNYPIFKDNYLETGSNFGASGLYLMSCKYYNVKNNYFVTNYTSNYNSGIWANNSQAGAHQVYRNTFNKLLMGIAAVDNNSGATNNIDGLKMNCNDFTGTANKYDIALMGSIPSVDTWQGASTSSPLTLVRNKYAAVCSPSGENKFYLAQTIKPIINHASNSDAFCLPTPQPDCSDNSVLVSNTGFMLNYAIHCPADPSGSSTGGISQINSNLVTSLNQATALEGQYNSLIDGGNTRQLLSFINTNNSPGDIKNLLLSHSPYLSDQVLLSYFSDTIKAPPGHIKEVHSLNYPVTPEVWNAILALNLPNGILNEIKAKQYEKVLSTRQTKEGELFTSLFKLQSDYQEKINYYLSDSTSESNDTIINLFQKNIGRLPDAPLQLFYAYLDKGDYEASSKQIDYLISTGNPFYIEISELLKTLILIQKKPEKCFAILTDGAIKNTIVNYANDPNKAGSDNAKAILRFVLRLEYPFDRPFMDPATSGNREASNNPINNLNTLSDIDIFPNPSQDVINLMYENQEKGDAIVQIQDMLGNIVLKNTIRQNSLNRISTSNTSNGIYFISIIKDNKTIHQRKIVITK